MTPSRDWRAISEWGDWTAMARHQEHPTRRDTIVAATEIRDFTGYGWDGHAEFIELVRSMEPVLVHHTTGEAALDASEGVWDDYYEEHPTGELLAWVVRT